MRGSLMADVKVLSSCCFSLLSHERLAEHQSIGADGVLQVCCDVEKTSR